MRFGDDISYRRGLFGSGGLVVLLDLTDSLQAFFNDFQNLVLGLIEDCFAGGPCSCIRCCDFVDPVRGVDEMVYPLVHRFEVFTLEGVVDFAAPVRISLGFLLSPG
ncbi:hypothetical protein [Mycobacteroides salmoniphilum]|uniref:hypothetical protein n=1 Tax=Mycobacteroides salmoniphilum TaxID=404941 RepID=UPI001065AFBA|nr:hypothetical protein [Mycobacteroides salmoniphilum]